MTLIKIFELNEGFLPEATNEIMSREEVKKVGETFHLNYRRDSWRISSERIVYAARKRGIPQRDYNAYVERADDSLSPIQAEIQLYLISKTEARKERKKNRELALDALWEATGY